jgi:mycofactocin system glycosyltransferase
VIPLPPGFGIVFDRSLRYRDDGLLVGGTPRRAIRLTESGRRAFVALRNGGSDAESARMLARRLTDAGMAHPRPPRGRVGLDVTVVVPVRDRAPLLDRCLAALGRVVPVVVVDDGSRDGRAIADVCERNGATLLRLETGGGAAAARNEGVAATASELVAFVDSDCIAGGGWLERLVDHFADPLVGAVAPRVVPVSAAPAASVRARYSIANSPLDMGHEEGLVVPGRRIPYVPTAALVARRDALGRGFDPALRYGEDVDLVWRLHDSGWRVRYVPQVSVEHDEPATWRGLLRRRFRYGTSAAPLARRHPGRLSHAVIRPWPATAAALALGGRPRAALAVTAGHAAVLTFRLRKSGVRPTRACASAASAVGHTVVGTGHAATMFAAPALFAALVPRATRRRAIVLLAAAPLTEWARRPPPLDPLRWTAACIADDVAYGSGVWRGCTTERTLAPVRPTLT